MATVRITSHQIIPNGNGSITISGINENELELFHSVFAGVNWFCAQNGVAKFAPLLQPLPNPIEDEEMLPFWKKEPENQMEQMEMFNVVFEELTRNVLLHAHITITGLCGYAYTPENYKFQSKKLISYGFIQMRSMRGSDGKYWEQWYLPGTWHADGDLKEFVEKIPDSATEQEKIKAVINFLAENASFGSLDVSIQRLAMMMD